MLNFRFALTIRKMGLPTFSLIVAMTLLTNAAISPAFADTTTLHVPITVVGTTKEVTAPDGSTISAHYVLGGLLNSATGTTKQGVHLNIGFQYGTSSTGFTLSGDALAPVTISIPKSTTPYAAFLQATTASRKIRMTMLRVYPQAARSPIAVWVSDSQASVTATPPWFTDAQKLLNYSIQEIDDAFPGYDYAAEYFAPLLLSWWTNAINSIGFSNGQGLCAQSAGLRGANIVVCSAFDTETVNVGSLNISSGSGISPSCNPSVNYVPGECNTKAKMMEPAFPPQSDG